MDYYIYLIASAIRFPVVRLFLPEMWHGFAFGPSGCCWKWWGLHGGFSSETAVEVLFVEMLARNIKALCVFGSRKLCGSSTPVAALYWFNVLYRPVAWPLVVGKDTLWEVSSRVYFDDWGIVGWVRHSAFAGWGRRKRRFEGRFKENVWNLYHDIIHQQLYYDCEVRLT